jgi:hypothetical protein
MVTLRPFSSVCFAVAMFVGGCSSPAQGGPGSSSSQADADPPQTDPVAAICAKFVACGKPDVGGAPYTLSSCMSDLDGWVPPDGCAPAASAATCGEINSNQDSPFLTTCLPSCPARSPNVCDGDDITVCDPSGDFQMTFTCDSQCSASSATATYTGVCGATYKGVETSNGQQQCWCN